MLGLRMQAKNQTQIAFEHGMVKAAQLRGYFESPEQNYSWEFVKKLLLQLNLCYLADDGGSDLFVPALLEEEETNQVWQVWRHTGWPADGHLVGCRLSCSEKKILGLSFFEKLQAKLANGGGLVTAGELTTGKRRSTYIRDQVAVLLEYLEDVDCLLVLVRPTAGSTTGQQVLKQLGRAVEFVAESAAGDRLGVALERRVLRPLCLREVGGGRGAFARLGVADWLERADLQRRLDEDGEDTQITCLACGSGMLIREVADFRLLKGDATQFHVAPAGRDKDILARLK